MRLSTGRSCKLHNGPEPPCEPTSQSQKPPFEKRQNKGQNLGPNLDQTAYTAPNSVVILNEVKDPVFSLLLSPDLALQPRNFAPGQTAVFCQSRQPGPTARLIPAWSGVPGLQPREISGHKQKLLRTKTCPKSAAAAKTRHRSSQTASTRSAQSSPSSCSPTAARSSDD